MGFRLRVIAAAAAVLLSPAGAGVAAERAFLAAVEDLPLAPGLVERPAAGLVFDTAEGRIIEAHAEGAVSAGDVEAFYAEALPELGWRRRSRLTFGREGELLELRLTPTGKGVAVQFTLQPGR